jgi:sialate O-acetylesterase
MKIRSLCILLLAVLSHPVFAMVDVAGIFGDNMVFQREMTVPVWGNAAPGETVCVEFAGQSVEAVADDSGKWCAYLAPLKACAEPMDMLISGADSSVTLTNVLVGDVWLCSGQSNMDHTMRMLHQREEEILAATNYPRLRLFKVGYKTNPEQPEEDVQGEWRLSSAESAGDFSATATYFGRSLCRDPGVPVGLLHCAWGGTAAQLWTSRRALNRLPFMAETLERGDNALLRYDPVAAQADYEQRLGDWRKKVEAGEAAGRKPSLWNPYTSPWMPATLYNGMVAPLIPMAMRGVIWYQGEANAGWHQVYRDLFSALINDWRQAWGQGDFPFLFVQLANFTDVQSEPVQQSASWAYLREAQAQTLAVPNTAMAVITDAGDADNIHPEDKKTVGERLALAARAVAYGEEIVYSGPLFQGLEIRGSEAIIHFDHVGSGLMVKGDVLKGFAIKDEDGDWRWGNARIEGDTVVVSAEGIFKPVAVRYNWADNPVGNLYNKEGLPASLFRTDVAE